MSSILTVNGGSSSLKCALYQLHNGDTQLRYGFKLSNILGQPKVKISDAAGNLLSESYPDFSQVTEGERHHSCLDFVFNWLRERPDSTDIIGVCHRVVHGGEVYKAPMLITDEIQQQLRQFIPLAPLHQPYNLYLIDACHALLPKVPQLACFDTMFHSGQPQEAQQFALPRQYTEEGVRRYGFHGLSYEFIQRQLTALGAGQNRTVVAHLGAGASMCAIKNGQSITSTMGFTAVEGLPMGSRTGSIDPGVLLYLMRQHHMDADQLETLLYKQSGWLGVSGVSSDMQELLASDNPHAKEAVDLFTYRAAREIGSLSAALEGLDQIVFTGGVGENSAPIRAAICARSAWLGVEIDAAANNANAAVISTPTSKVVVRVIPTDEEAMLALHGRELLA